MSLPFSDRLHALVLRFVLSGGLATAVHWCLMALLIRFHLPAEVATALGAFAGAIANYRLQQRFTFRVRVVHARALPRYVLVTALGWLANLGLFAALHGWLDLGVSLAQLLTTVVVALFNFTLYRRVVFHDRIHSGVAI